MIAAMRLLFDLWLAFPSSVSQSQSMMLLKQKLPHKYREACFPSCYLFVFRDDVIVSD